MVQLHKMYGVASVASQLTAKYVHVKLSKYLVRHYHKVYMAFPERNISTGHQQAALQAIIDSAVGVVFFLLTQGDTSVLDLFLAMLHSQCIQSMRIYIVLTDHGGVFTDSLYNAMDHRFVRNRCITVLDVPDVTSMFP